LIGKGGVGVDVLRVIFSTFYFRGLASDIMVFIGQSNEKGNRG
jgi:hypothetical protein